MHPHPLVYSRRHRSICARTRQNGGGSTTVRTAANPPTHLISTGAPVAPFPLSTDPWSSNGFNGSLHVQLLCPKASPLHAYSAPCRFIDCSVKGKARYMRLVHTYNKD
jgi:hypothetical protein